MQFSDVFEFQEAYPTKEQREEVLPSLSDEQIWVLIDSCGTKQGKIYYSKFLKNKERENVT